MYISYCPNCTKFIYILHSEHDSYYCNFLTQIEGLLSGDLTLSLNTTIEGEQTLLTMLTTSTASLFTMPGECLPQVFYFPEDIKMIALHYTL